MISMGNGVNISLFPLPLYWHCLVLKIARKLLFNQKYVRFFSRFVSVSGIDVAKMSFLRWKIFFCRGKLQTGIQINKVIVCLCFLNDSHHYFLLHYSNDESHLNLVSCQQFTIQKLRFRLTLKRDINFSGGVIVTPKRKWGGLKGRFCAFSNKMPL